jgi:phosphoglycerol transferase MdoB-like AlkP superfamily enzyme
MNKIFKGRFGTIYALALVFFISSLITRVVLLFYAHSVMSYNIWELVKSFAVGFFFDIIAFGYFMIPFLLITILIPAKIARTAVYRGLTWFFFSLAVFLLVFNSFAEYFFWDEFEVRFNFIAVDYLIYTTEVIGNIVESYSLPLLLSAVGVLSAIVIWFIYRKKYISVSLKSDERFVQRLKTALMLVIIPVFGSLFVTLSWSQISANSYNNELAKNGIYSLFEAFKNNKLDYDRFYITEDDKEAFAHTRSLIADTSHRYLSEDVMKPVFEVNSTGEERKMNVMFIAVESLSGEYLSYIKEPDEYESPFLDSLAENSLFFTNMYANGTRTVRGLEALSLSIPPTPGTSIVRRQNNDNLYSMGEVFQRKGYDNKFIYGGYGYFDNMNAFFSGNGFDIVDRSALSKEEISFANVWGACDQDMYRRAIKEADKSVAAGKPFLNFIMTTSNHRPYTFPNIGIPLADNRTGGVRYTDYALQWLFEQSKNKSWFKNTIFVIVADHCGSSAGKTELPILKYQIPCFIYAPEITSAKKIDKLCSQVDVLPTILSLLNWKYSSTFYGKDILNMSPTDERAFIGTYQKLGYVKGNQVVVLSPQKKITQYNFDRFTGEMKPETVSPLLKKDVVSLFQTAEHMFISGFNKAK